MRNAIQNIGYIFLAFSAFIAISNFCLSFIRPLYYRIRKQKYKFVSVIPLLGNLFLVPAGFLLPKNAFLGYTALAIVLIDTGGLPWFLLMLLGNWIFERKKKTP